jgi:Ser/Thr protein kinase RdoA (MazF antagonist)
MKLFQPNNLSKRTPEFTPLHDQTITAQIASVLLENYALSPLASVSVFSGANVSSQNFKVEAAAKKWFLKSRAVSLAEKMREEARLTFALSELGQRVPRIVRSRVGELVTVIDERCWVLYEFQEGDYFAGRGGEMQAAAETFAELSLAARQLFSASGVVEDPLPRALEELLDRARAASDIGSLCAAHGVMILDQLRLVTAQLRAHPVAPMHLDYHPLNLLMSDGRVVCVVDLEHLKPYSVVCGLGFAAFKLIRQSMVDNEREVRSPEVWSQAWQKTFPEHRFSTTELGLGARARVLKLISLILDATLNRGDHRSNYDLEKQIFSLYEADVIFGRL